MIMTNTFSAYDIRGRADETLTTEYVWNVGRAFADWLPADGPVAVSFRSDTNLQTMHAFTEGVLLQGRDVLNTGEDNQQGLIALIRDSSVVGGAIVTHDSLQNIEIITLLNSDGVGITSESGLVEIGQLVEAANFVPAAQKGELKEAV